jgi:hypothetical protein
MVAVDHRAPDHEPTEARHTEEVHQCLSLGGYPFGPQTISDAVSGHGTFRLQRRDDHIDGPLDLIRRYIELAEAVVDSRSAPWGRERTEPPEVHRPDEVERAPVEPGDHQPSIVQSIIDVVGHQSMRATPNCEPEAAVVLSLHGEDAFDHFVRCAHTRVRGATANETARPGSRPVDRRKDSSQ